MANGLKPIGDSIKVIIEKLKKEREERKRNKNKPVRTQPKLPGMMSGGMAGLLGRRKKVEAGEPGPGDMKKKKERGIGDNQRKKKKRLEELRKELGMKKGGSTEPKYTVEDEVKSRMRKELPRTGYGMGLSPITQLRRHMHRKKIKKERARDDKKVAKKAKGGKITQKDINKTEEGVMIILGKASGGITGKTTFGELSKRKPLKKGIRLKGKGSSFMKEYKKRVYNRAGGGSMNGGVRGTGIAIKGTNFKGVF